MKRVTLGIFGLGTVGRGVVRLLHEERELLRQRVGVEFEIKAVVDRSWHKKSDSLYGVAASNDPELILGDPSIDLIVELLGGIEPARTHIETALSRGKGVVTANKALLARHGREIFKLAAEQSCEIGFEAAVAGALPVIKLLRRTLVINQIRGIYGILNGTCNFIITRMQQDGMDYGEALALAQELGFAEADPTFDVEGLDAAQKLALLAGLAFDRYVPEERVHAEGISQIRRIDLEIAARMGMALRLLGIAQRQEDGRYSVRVHPALISEHHQLASVRNESNAVFFDTSYSGPVLVVGNGAGSLPTAAAVISDLVAISRHQPKNSECWMVSEEELSISTEHHSRFYLRFQTLDQPGVLAEIARILAENGISIATVQQQEGVEPVQVVVTTHEADESALLRALCSIDPLPMIQAPTTSIRILDQL